LLSLAVFSVIDTFMALPGVSLPPFSENIAALKINVGASTIF
jgi:hypothetical protein